MTQTMAACLPAAPLHNNLAIADRAPAARPIGKCRAHAFSSWAMPTIINAPMAMFGSKQIRRQLPCAAAPPSAPLAAAIALTTSSTWRLTSALWATRGKCIHAGRNGVPFQSWHGCRVFEFTLSQSQQGEQSWPIHWKAPKRFFRF